MLATAGALPDDDGQWAYEVKWDGARVIAEASAAGVRYTSRLGNDVTAAYPELRNLAGQLGSRQAILDGEFATFDRRGRTDFGLLQSRMHVRRPTSTLVTSTPVTFLIFDVLHVNDTSLLDASYDTRREALEGLELAGDAWRAPPAIVGDGATILESSKAQGLEGIVAKRRGSPYLPGRRTKPWLKIKNIRRTSVVIVGWTPGEGGRAGQVGSLLLAVNADRGLEYAGHVGTGFTQATLRRLQQLEPLTMDQSPLATPVPRAHAAGAVYIRPVLVAEIDYTEWTREGRLRHPSFKGLREDVDPDTVVRE